MFSGLRLPLNYGGGQFFTSRCGYQKMGWILRRSCKRRRCWSFWVQKLRPFDAARKRFRMVRDWGKPLCFFSQCFLYLISDLWPGDSVVCDYIWHHPCHCLASSPSSHGTLKSHHWSSVFPYTTATLRDLNWHPEIFRQTHFYRWKMQSQSS